MIECGKQDLNLHGVNPHQALNLARLPIPPFPQGALTSEACSLQAPPSQL
jgi:hypothetical protein